MRRISAIVGLLVVGASMMAYSQESSSIEGAWRITETISTGENASSNKTPQPGLFLFTKKHYSVVSVGGTAPRPDLGAPADPAKLTDAEKLARYEVWDAFSANAGTYSVSGNTVTLSAMVAKNPAVMARPGTPREFKIEGNTMTLTQKSADGKRETRTVLTRAE